MAENRLQAIVTATSAIRRRTLELDANEETKGKPVERVITDRLVEAYDQLQKTVDDELSERERGELAASGERAVSAPAPAGKSAPSRKPS